MSDQPTKTTDAPGPAGAVREAIWAAIHGAVGFGGNHAVEITQATVAVIEQLEALGIDLRQDDGVVVSYKMRLCGDCSSGPPCRCSNDPAVVEREWISGRWVWIATCPSDVMSDQPPADAGPRASA